MMFLFSSTTALVQKLGKECDDANLVMKQVEAIEIANGQKRTFSAGDSSGSLSKSKCGLLEKAQSGTNLAAFSPRYMWIRVALFEKRLQRIVAYLVAESDK